MWKTILDLIFPINCLGCGQTGQFICFSCFKKIPLNTKPPLNNLLVASYYGHPLVKEAIHQYKYNFIKDLAQPLGLLMVKKIKRSCIEKKSKRLVIENDVPCEARASFSGRASEFNHILIPIPLHPKRLRWRGFNQSELLAQIIGQELNIPVINNILVRTKHTLPQAQIQNAEQRKQNISQAFELRMPKRLVIENNARYGIESYIPCACLPARQEARVYSKGRTFNSNLDLKTIQTKTLILIDDVTTTGATLEQATQILKPLKPKQIWSLVIAHG